MSNVIPFKPPEPEKEAEQEKVRYLEGQARCLECKHEWHAVVEECLNGHNHGLECPSCHLNKGVFVNLCGSAKGTPVYHCACGNYLFEARVNGLMCIYCGAVADWDRMAEALKR
jgi:hypothetical protein